MDPDIGNARKRRDGKFMDVVHIEGVCFCSHSIKHSLHTDDSK